MPEPEPPVFCNGFNKKKQFLGRGGEMWFSSGSAVGPAPEQASSRAAFNESTLCHCCIYNQ